MNNSNDTTGLILFDRKFSELQIDLKKSFYGYKLLNERTVKQIVKVLEEGILDTRGNTWISYKKSHHIFRTNSQKSADYFIAKIRKEYKTHFNGDEYIDIVGLIPLLMERSRENPGNDYLKCVIEALNLILNNKDVRINQFKYIENVRKKVKYMKRKRINKFKIKKDELTGEWLEKNSEFHHIRSQTMYPDLALKVENGLIINKDIHRIITREVTNDEDELYELCRRNKWNDNWYITFKKYINNN